jgi:hypothetical protein
MHATSHKPQALHPPPLLVPRPNRKQPAQKHAILPLPKAEACRWRTCISVCMHVYIRIYMYHGLITSKPKPDRIAHAALLAQSGISRRPSTTKHQVLLPFLACHERSTCRSQRSLLQRIRRSCMAGMAHTPVPGVVPCFRNEDTATPSVSFASTARMRKNCRRLWGPLASDGKPQDRTPPSPSIAPPLLFSYQPCRLLLPAPSSAFRSVKGTPLLFRR